MGLVGAGASRLSRNRCVAEMAISRTADSLNRPRARIAPESYLAARRLAGVGDLVDNSIDPDLSAATQDEAAPAQAAKLILQIKGRSRALR